MGMNIQTKILLLIVIFLTGCTSGQDNCSMEDKTPVLKNQNLVTKNQYTIQRASNGVYVYTDLSINNNLLQVDIKNN